MIQGTGKCASHSAIVRCLYRAKEDTHSDASMGYYALLNANHKWSKMLDNGPAVSVPEREICFRKTLDECGTHLISEFTIKKKNRPDSSHIQPFRSVPREVSQPCIPHWPPNKQSCWSLICFRHGDVASTCDVEQMLYSFHISTRFYVSWPPCMLLETKGQNLAHELLVIWMSEVSAIVSAHSITTIPSDSDEPLAPIDTLHVANSEDPPVRSSPRKNASQNLYAHQADQFWSRSRGEYLQNLQVRTKYNWERRNLVAGEMVTLKDKQTHRNNWPLGLVLDRRKSPKGDCADLQG